MEILDIIKNRRSVREFLDKEVDDSLIEKILEAGRWAPSGLNNQPWRFVIVRDRAMKDGLAEQTKYGHIIKGAPASIAVFLDNSAGYDRTKDVQAMGACIQNMLLEAHSLGLGTCWLGEILNKKEAVGEILNTPGEFELMAVIAVGHPAKKQRTSERKPMGGLLHGD
ncbi:MAG: nitroreductase family protein [Candidatus Altiarchaeota archaeon]|nr:nitroreductase family protein [Candidatus Altiarchaeota archaeon]